MMGRLRTLCMQIAQALEILSYNHINTLYKRDMVGIYSICLCSRGYDSVIRRMNILVCSGIDFMCAYSTFALKLEDT